MEDNRSSTDEDHAELMQSSIRTFVSSKALRNTLILICILVLITGCNFPRPILTVSPLGSDPSAPQLRSTITPAGHSSPPSLKPTILTSSPQTTPAAPSPTPDLRPQVPTQYSLEALFDYEQHTLKVVETINYVNLSADTLNDLILIVEPNLASGGFTLLSIAWQDGTIIDTFDLHDNQMHIPLAHPLQPAARLGMKLQYRLAIPQLGDNTIWGRPVAYGYSDMQTNIVDWYPYLPPYSAGKGWLVHPVWGLGEYQVYDEADYQVTLTLAAPVAGLVVAASTPAEQEGGHYQYHLQAARTFAFSASTDYVVQSTTVGEVTVNCYSFSDDTHPGKQALNTTASALDLYSHLISPYPHSTLAVVEADFLDGMEYDGLYFLGHAFYDLYDDTPESYLTFISAHETAHQWWYGLVGNDQALEPWLDEALSTYMELLFYESIYSDLSPHTGDPLVDWWWNFRINSYAPQGWVDSSIYDFNTSRSYRDAVYLDGAKFLDEVRNRMGDKAFFAALRAYARNHAHSIATGGDFFTVLKTYTSQDLNDLIAQYFQSGGSCCIANPSP